MKTARQGFICFTAALLCGCVGAIDRISTTSLEVLAPSEVSVVTIIDALEELGAVRSERGWVGSVPGAELFEAEGENDPFRIDVALADDGRVSIRFFFAGLGYPGRVREELRLSDMRAFYLRLRDRVPMLPDPVSAEIQRSARD